MFDLKKRFEQLSQHNAETVSFVVVVLCSLLDNSLRSFFRDSWQRIRRSRTPGKYCIFMVNLSFLSAISNIFFFGYQFPLSKHRY